MFRDNETARVYVFRDPVDISALVLQPSEIDEVRWFDLDEVREEIRHSRERFCVPMDGLEILRKYLGSATGDKKS
jgi:NADH pyrophosphatase NudC (nudix superfamily)